MLPILAGICYINSTTFSMMVFLPKSGHGIPDIIGEIKKADWNSLRKGMGISEVDLWLPSI